MVGDDHCLNEQVLTGFRQRHGSNHCILAFDGTWAVCISADCVQEDREGLGVSGRSAEIASRLGFSEPIPTSGSSAVASHVGLGLPAWWPDLVLIPPGGGGEMEETPPKMEAPGTVQSACYSLARASQRVLKLQFLRSPNCSDSWKK